MKKQISKAAAMVKKGDFRSLFRRIRVFIKKKCDSLRAAILDRRLGGRSVGKTLPTKYAGQGAHFVESTDYRCLDKIFRVYPLKEEDVLVDVGCGEGRVLTYLYLQGFRGRIVGIELDPDAAETARQRTKKCPNAEVVCGNVLECPEILKEATACYLFNPFNEEILARFVQMLEERCQRPMIVYYCCDVYRQMLQTREKWAVLRRGMVQRPGQIGVPFSVYRYAPDGEPDEEIKRFQQRRFS